MNADDLTSIERTISHLVELDTLHGSAGLDQLGVRAFADARRRLAVARCPASLTSDLADAVAELGQVSAWLLHDAGHHEQARIALSEALTIASTARGSRRRTELMIIDQLSMLAERSGAWSEALRLADRNLAIVEGSSSRLETMCRIRRGRALAKSGSSAGLDELRHATALLCDGTRNDDPPWAWWITMAELAVHRALVCSQLGSHRQAVDLAQTAVAELDSRQRRDQTTFRTVLLRVAVAAGAWREVLDVASELSPLLPVAGSARAVGVVRSVANHLPDQAPTVVTDALQHLLDTTGEDGVSSPQSGIG